MAFNPDPFAQANAEVNNKSMGDQIAHSGIFHSFRSAWTNKGTSGVSKGVGALVGVGKLFLAAIPVPIVGAIVGATVDAINGKLRSARHEHNLGKATSDEEKAKFSIKELTVENLYRYRWKLSHAFEELQAGVTAYNNSSQSCDDMYEFALLYEQLERRKVRLNDELQKFKNVIDYVDAWKAEVQRTHGAAVDRARNLITEKMRKEIDKLNAFVPANPADATKIAQFMAAHASCSQWCYCKKTAKYDPNTNWSQVKEYSGKAASFLLPIAISTVAVRQSDYTNNADNSKFRE
jgi:hypothetical protein